MRVSPSWAAFYGHTLLVHAITLVLRPTATYQAIDLGVSSQWLGMLAASFAIVPLLLAVFTGRVVDRLGERVVMMAGGLLTALSAASLIVLGGHVFGLVLGMIMAGLGHLCGVVGQQALVANRTDRSRYDAAFGHYTFMASAGQALGPMLIVLFGGSAAIPDTEEIFKWALGLSAVLLPLCVLLPKPDPGQVSDATSGSASTVRELARRKGVVRAITVSCVVLAAVDITVVYLPALGTERGISAGTIGALLTLRAVASMFCRFFLGLLVAGFGRTVVLVTSIGASAVGMVLLAVPMPIWLLVILVTIAGVGLGAGQPLTMSWIAEATPPGMRGRAMSLRLTGNRLGQVLVPSVAGLLAASTGAAGVLVVTGAVLGAAAVAAREVT